MNEIAEMKRIEAWTELSMAYNWCHRFPLPSHPRNRMTDHQRQLRRRHVREIHAPELVIFIHGHPVVRGHRINKLVIINTTMSPRAFMQHLRRTFNVTSRVTHVRTIP